MKRKVLIAFVAIFWVAVLAIGTTAMVVAEGGTSSASCASCACAVYEVCDTSIGADEFGSPQECATGCHIEWATVEVNLLPPELVPLIPKDRIKELVPEKSAEIVNELTAEQLAGLNNEQLDMALFKIDDLTLFSESGADLLNSYFQDRYNFEFYMQEDSKEIDFSGLTMVQDGTDVYLSNNGVKFYISEFVNWKDSYNIGGIKAFANRDNTYGFELIMGEDSFWISGADTIVLADPGVYGNNMIIVDDMVVDFNEGDGNIVIRDGQVMLYNTNVVLGDNQFFGDVVFNVVEGKLDASKPIRTKTPDSWACVDDRDRCIRTSNGAASAVMCLECAETELSELDAQVEAGEIAGYVFWDQSFNAAGNLADSATVRGQVISNLYKDGPIVEGLHKDMIFKYRDDESNDDIEFIFEGTTPDGQEIGGVRLYGKELMLTNEDLGSEQAVRVYEKRLTSDTMYSNAVDMMILFNRYPEAFPPQINSLINSDIDTATAAYVILSQFSTERNLCKNRLENENSACDINGYPLECENQLKDKYGENYNVYKELYESEFCPDCINNPKNDKQVLMHHSTYIVDSEGQMIDTENLYASQAGNMLIHQYETHSIYKDFLNNKFLTSAFEEGYEQGKSGQELGLFVLNEINLASHQMFFEERGHYFNGYIEYAEEANWWPKSMVKEMLYDEDSAYMEIIRYAKMDEGANLIHELQSDPSNPMTLQEIYASKLDNEMISAAFDDPGLKASLNQEIISSGEGTITIGGRVYDVSKDAEAASLANILSAAREYNKMGYYERAQEEYLKILAEYDQVVNPNDGKTVLDIVSENWKKIGYTSSAGGDYLVVPPEVQALVDQGYLNMNFLQEIAMNKKDYGVATSSEGFKKFFSEMIPDTPADVALNFIPELGTVGKGLVAAKGAFAAFRAGEVALSAVLKTGGFALASISGAAIIGVGGLGGMSDNLLSMTNDAARIGALTKWGDELEPQQLKAVYELLYPDNTKAYWDDIARYTKRMPDGSLAWIVDPKTVGIGLTESELKQLWVTLPPEERIRRAESFLERIRMYNGETKAAQYRAAMEAAGLFSTPTGVNSAVRANNLLNEVYGGVTTPNSQAYQAGRNVNVLIDGQPGIGVVGGVLPDGRVRVWVGTRYVDMDTSQLSQLNKIDFYSMITIEKYGGMGTATQELAEVYGYKRSGNQNQIWLYNRPSFEAWDKYGQIPEATVRFSDGTEGIYKLHIAATAENYDLILRRMGIFLDQNGIPAKIAPGIKVATPEMGKQYGKVITIYTESPEQMMEVVEEARLMHIQTGVTGLSPEAAAGANLQYEMAVPGTGNTVYYTIEQIDGVYLGPGGDGTYADRTPIMKKYWGQGPLDEYITKNSIVMGGKYRIFSISGNQYVENALVGNSQVVNGEKLWAVSYERDGQSWRKWVSESDLKKWNNIP